MFSLRSRIVISVSALLLGTGGCILVLVNGLMSQQLHEAVLEATARTNAMVVQALDQKQAQLSAATALMTVDPGMRSIAEADQKTTSEWALDVAHRLQVDWVLICDGAGRVKGQSSTTDPLSGKTEAIGVPSALALKPWAGAVASGGNLYLASTRPIQNGPYIRSVLTCALKVDRRLAREFVRSSKVEMAIVYRGATVASTFDEPLGVPAKGVYAQDLSGVTYIGTSAPLNLHGLGSQAQVVAFIPRESVTAPFDKLWRGILAAFALSIVIAALLGASLARNVTRPIEALVVDARRVQEGDWPDPVATSRTDELGLLYQVFYQMTGALQDNNERLLAMLDIDPLTQLWNYRSFREKLEVALAESRDNGAPLSLVLIDLDDFDSFNRAQGGVSGDRVLQHVAEILRTEAGSNCPCARSGGDEFMVLLCEDDPKIRAEHFRAAIEADTGLTASIGYATLAEHTWRSDLLMLAATLAKDQAKQAGRNRVRGFESFEIAGTEDELRQFLQQGSYAAVRALAEAVDAKDEYTRGHSQRVADYAKGIALALGLDSGFVELVYVSGTLHDVGKIGVPDDVLKKDGKLTDEEFAQIKRHPELGEKIVSQIPQLRDALPGIRFHHERWDGRGYPDGIAGEQIPLVARILALADTYDAMTSDRPYRKGMPAGIAIPEMIRNSGTQFDPSLMSAFLLSIGYQQVDKAA